MTTNNLHANNKPAIVNFKHRLIRKDADVTNIIDLVDTVDDMTYRTAGVLEVLSRYILNSQSNEILDKESIYGAIQSAIKDINDLSAVVNTYADNFAAETKAIDTTLMVLAKRQA